MVCLDTSLFSRKDPQIGAVRCLRLREGTRPGTWEKERGLTSVRPPEVLFCLVSGDKGLGWPFMKPRLTLPWVNTGASASLVSVESFGKAGSSREAVSRTQRMGGLLQPLFARSTGLSSNSASSASFLGWFWTILWLYFLYKKTTMNFSLVKSNWWLLILTFESPSPRCSWGVGCEYVKYLIKKEKGVFEAFYLQM